MRKILFFFYCFMTWMTCIQSQTVTLQPTSVCVNHGEKATLICTVSVKDSHATAFYRQVPGEAPAFIGSHFHSWDSPKYGSGFSAEQFTITKDSGGVVFQLTVKAAQKSDTAIYYCGKWFTSNALSLFSSGTKVVVTVQQFPDPSVLVMPPSADELSSKGTATLSCMIDKLSVGLADVNWTVDGKSVNNGISTSLASRGSDSTFSLSSYLTVPATDWNTDKVYSCRVQQAGASSAASHAIRVSECN